MAVFSLIALFSACGDSKKEEIPTPSIEYAGFYKGNIVVSLGDTDFDPILGKIELIKKSESLAKLELRNFKFGAMSLGDIIVDDVVVTTKEKTIYLNGEAKLTLALEGVPATCSVKVEATVVDEKMVAKIDVSVEDPEGGDPMLVSVLFNGDFMTKNESSEAKILSFGLKDVKTTTVIENDTVKLTVEYENSDMLASITPEIKISEKAKISPAADAEQNFTDKVEYVVTSEDGITTTKYVVITTISNVPVLSSEAKILTFGLKDIESTFTIENDIVKLKVDYADLEKLAKVLPVITISEGAKISPDLDVEQDFNKILDYVVTAEDGVTETKYTVVTEIINAPVLSAEAEIISFELKDIKADVVIEENNIKVTVDHTFAEAIKTALPIIKISEKATISPDLTIAQDFGEEVKYVVTAEDGKTTTTYTVHTTVTAAPLSKEAKMLSFAIDGLNAPVKIDGTRVSFTVAATDKDKLVNALPIIIISPKATISPDLKVAQDFTKPVVYTVTAEDGVTAVSYSVVANIIVEPSTIISLDMNNVNESAYTSGNLKGALPNTVEPLKWNSSDGGVSTLITMKNADKFGVSYIKDDSDFRGPSYAIETLDTKGSGPILWFPATPKITSGSLFLGDFKLNTKVPLNSTKFGVVIDKKPLTVAGKLSYKSGAEYHFCPDPSPKKTHITEIVPGKKDEGLVSVVVYEVTNESETLTGEDIYTSNKIIGMAKSTFQDGFKGDFKLNVEYTKEFNPAKKYKMAVIFSASKDGDKFSGAAGSVLKLAKLDFGFE